MNRVNREKSLSPSQPQENAFPKSNLSLFGTSFLSTEAESKFLRSGEVSVACTSQLQVSCPPSHRFWSSHGTDHILAILVLLAIISPHWWSAEGGAL